MLFHLCLHQLRRPDADFAGCELGNVYKRLSTSSILPPGPGPSHRSPEWSSVLFDVECCQRRTWVIWWKHDKHPSFHEELRRLSDVQTDRLSINTRKKLMRNVVYTSLRPQEYTFERPNRRVLSHLLPSYNPVQCLTLIMRHLSGIDAQFNITLVRKGKKLNEIQQYHPICRQPWYNCTHQLPTPTYIEFDNRGKPMILCTRSGYHLITGFLLIGHRSF